MKIVMPLSDHGSDPTEVAIPWQELSKAGHELIFATPKGDTASLDPRMITGAGLGPWQFLKARQDARAAVTRLIDTQAFQKPLSYEDLAQTDAEGLILPGGHAPGMKSYLESQVLQDFTAAMILSNKPVAAICHGVIVLARAKNPGSEQSVIHTRKVTALPKSMEMSAWLLTALWLGNYYRTYPQSVEDEVRSVLISPSNFNGGPPSLLRDHPKKLSRGFIVRDGNLVTARWPGDAYRFSEEFIAMLKGG